MVTEHLCKLVDDLAEGCLAAQVIRGSSGPIAQIHHLLRPRTTMCIASISATTTKYQALTGSKPDNRPCMWCGDASKHATMVLCDR